MIIHLVDGTYELFLTCTESAVLMLIQLAEDEEFSGY